MTYHHNNRDPNLNNLHHAMEYRDGLPHLRVNLGSDSITITGTVNVGTEVKINNTEEQSIPVHLTDDPIGVTQSTTPWVISKNTTANSNSNPIFVNFTNSTIGVSGTVELGSTTLAALETINANVTGTVALDSASLAALETINANVSGTVTIQDGGGSITVDGSVNATVTFPTDITNADSNYEMNVARSLVSGQYLELKNGYCASMTSGQKTIWSQASAYPWSSWTTAQRLYIISDSASDVGQTVYIDGLDASYNPISTTVTTNGLTAVQTSVSFLRINHVYLTAGAVNVGMITQRLTSGTGTVIGGMYPGNSRNKQGVFTVPAGYTAYVLYGDVTSYKNGQGQVDGQVDMKVRFSQTAPFMNVFAAIAANGQYRNEFNVPLKVPAQSDIDVQFNPSGTCTVACNWQMVMIAN